MKKFLCLFIFSVCFLNGVFAQDLKFVQVTDVKYSGTNEQQNFKQLVKDINKLRDVKFVVFTGDNIQNANEKDLKSFLSEAKNLRRPFYLVIGDKDVNKHKHLSKKQYAKIAKKNISIDKNGNINYIFEKQGVVFMITDGAKDVVPSSNGYYKDDTVKWINTELDLNKNKNIIILQHFPLIPPEKNENYTTFKPDKYLEVLRTHSNVKAIISGHFGVNKEIEKDGITHISTAPAPNYRIIDIIDCTSANPTIWAELRQAE